MNKIFISYRRDDSAGYAGRLADRLATAFGEEQIFRDYEDIKPGQHFVESLENALANAKVLLVIIGKHWLTASNSQGQRRLDQANDYVRLEIETALKNNLTIIPILLNTTPMPETQELPTGLTALAFRQAITLSDSRWNRDVDNLIAYLRNLTGLAAPQPAIRLKRIALYSTLSACGAIALLFWLFLRQSDFSGQWYFQDGNYLSITQSGDQWLIEQIDPAMQTIYAKGSGQVKGLRLLFNLDPIYTDRFKYQGQLTKSWDATSLQGELLEILSAQRSELSLKKRSE